MLPPCISVPERWRPTSNASATDGYQVVFSLGELDPALSANDIIVADTANDKPLSDAQGR